MDPDETLRLARGAAKELEEALNGPLDLEAIDNAATDLLEYFQALDGWLSKGGFLPKRWTTKPKTRRELAEADDVGQFEFEHAGLRCFVRRFDKGSCWCGYVLLPEGHTWREAEVVWANVHGGVTWNRESPGHLEGVEGWLVGFDCKHMGDFNPGLDHDYNSGTWCDRKYVERECRRLAEQAAEALNAKEEE